MVTETRQLSNRSCSPCWVVLPSTWHRRSCCAAKVPHHMASVLQCASSYSSVATIIIMHALDGSMAFDGGHWNYGRRQIQLRCLRKRHTMAKTSIPRCSPWDTITLRRTSGELHRRHHPRGVGLGSWIARQVFGVRCSWPITGLWPFPIEVIVQLFNQYINIYPI